MPRCQGGSEACWHWVGLDCLLPSFHTTHIASMPFGGLSTQQVIMRKHTTELILDLLSGCGQGGYLVGRMVSFCAKKVIISWVTRSS